MLTENMSSAVKDTSKKTVGKEFLLMQVMINRIYLFFYYCKQKINMLYSKLIGYRPYRLFFNGKSFTVKKRQYMLG